MSRNFIINIIFGVLISLAIIGYLLTASSPSYPLVIASAVIAAFLVGAAIAELLKR
ncbi:hypothetical protein QUW13_00230 [Enterococcus hirae]|nr:hypothetical protein [Enterococcus hirae]